MLIEFRVKNFRSIRDEQFLSLQAGRCSELPHVRRRPKGMPANSTVLPVAAVFGANAAGKSALIRAMSVMKRIVAQSFNKADEGDSPNRFAVPHKLDHQRAAEPVEFEVTFIHDEVRHRYGFSVRNGVVESEHLTTWPKGSARMIFQRGSSTGDVGVDFRAGDSIEGGKGRAGLVFKQTHPQALFLSTGHKLNHPAVQGAADWIRNAWRVLDAHTGLHVGYTRDQCAEDPDVLRWTNEIMRWADLSIDGVRIADRDASGDPKMIELLSSVREDLRSELESSVRHEFSRMVHTIHLDRGQRAVEFEMAKDESHGAQRLFAFAGPLWDVLTRGLTLCVDELNTGMHHWMVRRLVELFQDPSTNPNNAQLIFTAHDPLLLDLTLLRRDQLNFVNKDSAGGSELYSLMDFETADGVRKNSVQLHRRYLAGDFGAIPSHGTREQIKAMVSARRP